MRAVVLSQKGSFDNFDNFQLQDLPVPKPANGQVLVKIAAAAVNPSDVKNAQGAFLITTYPRVPGRDFSGVVVEAGEDSADLIGAEVYGTGGLSGFVSNGTHAEFVLLNAKAVRPKPKNISFAQAAAVGIQYLTAYTALVDTAHFQKGESVLVIGARGAVGSSTLQLANMLGASSIYGTYSSAPSHTDSSATPHTPIDLSVAELPAFKVNVIIDTVGSPSLLSRFIPHLDNFGRYVFLSIQAKETGPGYKLSIDGFDFYRRNLRLLGLNTLEWSEVQAAEILEKLTPGFEQGELIPPIEIKEVKLENAKEVYEEQSKGGKNKIVLVP